MRKSAVFFVPLLVVGLAACQRQAARETAAAATPSPAVASAAPAASAPTAAPLAEAVPAETAAPAPPATAAPSPARSPRAAKAEVKTSAPSAPAGASPTRQDAEPPVRPRAEPIVLPAGTQLAIRLQDAVSSDKSQVEDAIRAELATDVSVDGRVVLPAGSDVIARVVVAKRSGRVKGRAHLVVDFEAVRLEGKRLAIDAPRWDITAGTSYKRDAAIAGGAAAAGAIIGGIAGGKKGALTGAAIGGAAGGGAVLVTRGNEVELPAGSVHETTLLRELRIE